MRNLADVMTELLVTTSVDEPVWRARELAQERQIRHLLVLENDDLVGVLCMCDVYEVDPDLRVSDCMSSPVLTVSSGLSIDEAVDLMRDKGICCLPVVDRGELVGIVTQTDLRRAGIQSGRFKLPALEEAGGGD